MIKFTVFYPNEPGARFDHAYYAEKHMPMVRDRMGAACDHYTIDKGMNAGAPGSAAPYVAMCHIYSASAETFQAGFGPHTTEIMADVKNYTDLTPRMQMSEVVDG